MITTTIKRIFGVLTGILCLSILMPRSSSAERLWWDGSKDNETTTLKLLSDNAGYWGDSVVTGVTYDYETKLSGTGDILGDKVEKFGRRLLDGRRKGDWGDWVVPVGVDAGPLTVKFDFKMPCSFSEIDLASRTERFSVRIESSNTDTGSWKTIYEISYQDCLPRQLHRIILSKPETGRYLRLTLQGTDKTELDEVLVWGDAQNSDTIPDSYRSIGATANMMELQSKSIPGIDSTSFTSSQFVQWLSKLGKLAEKPAVWSKVADWDSISNEPILPSPQKLLKNIPLLLTRNETEAAAIALTSTVFENPRTLEISLSQFKRVGFNENVSGIKGRLLVFGAIKSRNYGTVLSPLFAADNLLGKGLMEKYLTNGYGLRNFPKVTLSPGGSIVFWVRVTTDGAQPGVYEAKLSYKGGSPVTVRAEVVNVTLPSPLAFIRTWGETTRMFPFEYGDRMQREVSSAQSLGISVWGTPPLPGTSTELARKTGRVFIPFPGIPNNMITAAYTGTLKPENLTDQDKASIEQCVRDSMQQARDLKLTYNEWFIDIPDEPGVHNSKLYGVVTAIMHKIDPRIRIFVNPCFWGGTGPAPEQDVYDSLNGWYQKDCDISCPNRYLLDKRPMLYPLWDAPRFVRTYYVVTGQCKSERRENIDFYRKMGWDTFSRGWNGWGFYSYCSPRGNAWDDLDGSWTEDGAPDLMAVYPGLKECVPTRQSESAREAWEDFCLLTLMKNKGMKSDVDALVKAYKGGAPVESLRTNGLRKISQSFDNKFNKRK